MTILVPIMTVFVKDKLTVSVRQADHICAASRLFLGKPDHSCVGLGEVLGDQRNQRLSPPILTTLVQAQAAGEASAAVARS